MNKWRIRKKAKGLVKRDVIRIVTPGTILFENSIADKSNNYLAYLYETDNDIDAVLADISTGECWWGIWDKKKEREAFLICCLFMHRQKQYAL